MDFWSAHGIGFLLAIACFPRITMLVISLPLGILGWIGWVVAPHFVVAFYATTKYWDTNPVLCIIAWMMAFGGTSGEGKTVQHGVSRYRLTLG